MLFTLAFTVEETTRGCVLGVRNTGSESGRRDLTHLRSIHEAAAAR
jgi:hypothetical protein